MNFSEQKRQRLSRSLTLLACGMLIFLGWNAGSPAVLLAGLFIPSFGFLCAMVVMKQRDLLTVKRACVDGACEGERVDIVLTVTNPHWFPVFRMVVHDRFEPDLESDKLFSLTGVLPARSSVDFPFEAECYLDRGEYTLGPVTLRISDPLGLFIFNRTIDLPQTFWVYPEVVGMPPPPPAEGSPDIVPEGMPVARSGDSDLQYGVREYVPGDPFRHIHWPQTGKCGELMVREYEQITPANTYLLLDLPLIGRAGTGKFSTEEYGVQLVASIAAQMLHGGQPVGVLVNAMPAVFVELDYGHQHLIGVLGSLIPVREKSTRSITDELNEHPEVAREGSTFWLILSRVNFSIDYLESITNQFAWKACRIFLIIIDDEGMVAYESSPEQRSIRPDRDTLAAEIGNRVDGVWWVDITRGVKQSMKSGPL
ncbi:MAG: DUF58 domain-containing protein [Verrucomicrobiota bacterium]